MAASSSQERNRSNADSSRSNLVETLKELLVKYGTELLKPCDSVEDLLKVLHNLHHVLIHTLQIHKDKVALALQPSKEALIANELIRHAERDVRTSVASCITEIVRITAPDEPYEEDQMKEYFRLINSAFESLSCMSGPGYSKAVSILKAIASSQSCVIMLDLQLYDIIHQMFHLFFNVIRTSHSHAIFSSMVTIMTVTVHNNDDNDEFSVELAKILLAKLKKENQTVTPVSFQLAEDTFKKCSDALKVYLPEAARSLGIPVEDYAEVVASLFQDATQREENMDVEHIGVDASCNGEAGLVVSDDLSNFGKGNKYENLKTNGNSNENQTATHFGDERENLGSPKQQVDSKPDDIPVWKKRSRKPNSLLKPEEGYDSLWMLTHCTSIQESQDRSDKVNIISKHYLKRQRCSVRISPDDKSRDKTVVSEDLRRDINAKCPGGVLDHFEIRQGSLTKESPAKKGRGKTIISEDLIDDILNKRLPSQSRPTSSEGEALSRKVCKDKASEVKDASNCIGEEVVGCRIKVLWPLDEIFYEGKITSFDKLNKTHQVDYDDGDHEKLDLSKECWLLIGDDDLSTQEQQIDATTGASEEIFSDRERKSKGKEKEISRQVLG